MYNNSTFDYFMYTGLGYPQSILDYLEWLETFKKYETIIYQYVYAVFLIVGTLGNLPCAFYLSKYCRTAWSVCFYLILSMLFGLIELYTYCGNLWFLAVTGRNLTLEINLISNAVCKVYNFVLNVLIYFLSWVTVATSIETMITIVYPLNMYRMCTVERARSVVLLIIVLVVSFNLHYFWTIGLSTPETDPDVQVPMCHNNYQPQLSDEVSLVVPLFEFLLDNFLPFILVTIFACLSIVRLITRKNDVTFELKKYIVNVNMLGQLQGPTVVMLFSFAILKAFQCVEHVMRFIQSQFEINLLKETMSLQLANFTLIYFYISFKPVLFIVMCKQLRQDIIAGICKIGKFICRCDLCGQSRYKSYISPETATTTTRTLMSVDKQSNGDMLPNIKCTNV